jgi:malonate-semialdehyde dehydrogenase (acetylating)/methylmalonate-semialdehyde dehydrogenase
MSSVDVTVNRIANFVGGETVTSPSQRTLPVTNPTTGEVIGEVPMSTAAELDEAVTGDRRRSRTGCRSCSG